MIHIGPHNWRLGKGLNGSPRWAVAYGTLAVLPLFQRSFSTSAARQTVADITKESSLTLIVQIVLGLLLLGGFAGIYLSSKNWHWTQLVLVMFTFFAAIGFLVLGAETVRIHKNVRGGLHKLEKRIADIEQRNTTLVNGAGDELGIPALENRLRILTRERGRAWRGVMPAGQIDAQGRVTVDITTPSPHGLTKDTILYVFETGNPNNDNPAEGPQYLGELRVIDVQADGVTLAPVQLLSNRRRLAASAANGERPWSLYETMPTDRYRLFADLSEEQLRTLLPAESVEEYIRHGSDADPDDDEWHIAGYDEDGQRVARNNINADTTKKFHRSLHDYAFIFNTLSADTVITLAQLAAVQADIEKLQQAQKSALATGEFRQEQIDRVSFDLAGMQQDRSAIETHLDKVRARLDQFEKFIVSYRQANSDLDKRYTQRQLSMIEYINSIAPAPGS